jgi:hypothetical protein
VSAIATTWIKPIHKAKGKSVAATLADRIRYADNPDKTDGFEYVKSYGCDYYTAANEFALSKQLYENQTGRAGRNGDIIAYHLRQSFKPGEITPAEALEVGYALAEKFTHGKHQFVAAVHTDKQHIHCHIIFNAVNSDCDRKFRNPIGSMRIVRQISDYLCAERGLSVIENPAKSKGQNYGKLLGGEKPMSGRDRLRELMDENLIIGRSLQTFFTRLKKAGVEIKPGKQLSFRPPGSKRFFRQDTLGDNYSEEAVRERLMGKRIVEPRRKVAAAAVSAHAARVHKLLIDIEAKIKKAYSLGFEHYARIYNLKEMARTLIFLRDSGIGMYDELNNKIRVMDNEYSGRSVRIKEIETRQKEISELQKNISTYSKTKDAYNEYQRLKKYQQTKWEKFRNAPHPADVYYEERRADIMLCQAAKKYFDGQGYGKDKKIPTMQSLKEEYAVLDKEKRGLYNGCGKRRDDVIELKLARQNVDMFLDGTRETKLLERLHSKERGAR